MKVLWITNIIFPEANALLTGHGEHKSSGGWMLASANALTKLKEYNLIVACVSNSVKELKIFHGKNIKYYILPYGKGNKKYNSDYEHYWKKVSDFEKPDLVHIHGTEFSHGLAYVKVCGNKNVVVSIQGLVGEIGQHFCDGLTKWEIYRNLTIRDVFKGTCFSEKNKWIKRGEYEKELISSVNHVIGRTTWDKACVYAINPKINYHHCNETLREEFYDGKWDYSSCCSHSIFVSQAYYPIKGLHQVLKAMPLVLTNFPDAKLRIAGADITHYKIKNLTSYFRFLKELIEKLGLDDYVQFCGPLTSEKMKAEYLNANVFVCPSSIENSSNALSEAQILGVPCIASYVGGTPDMMHGLEKQLYRFEDIEMLAYKICEVFRNVNGLPNVIDDIANRHDPIHNIEVLTNIYKCIVNE